MTSQSHNQLLNDLLVSANSIGDETGLQLALSSNSTRVPDVVLARPSQPEAARFNSAVKETSHLVLLSNEMPVGVIRPVTGAALIMQLGSVVHQVSLAVKASGPEAKISSSEKVCVRFWLASVQRPLRSFGNAVVCARAEPIVTNKMPMAVTIT